MDINITNLVSKAKLEFHICRDHEVSPLPFVLAGKSNAIHRKEKKLLTLNPSEYLDRVL